MCIKQNHNMLKDSKTLDRFPASLGKASGSGKLTSKTPKGRGASCMGDNNESSDCALAVINIFQPCDYHYSNKYL